MEAAIIVTYRCNAKCTMCNTWKNQTRSEDEFSPDLLEKLPCLDFCNVTGGEPFLRDDIELMVNILNRKSKRIVISTNGYYTDRILAVAESYPNIGFRISIEGLPAANDELRGLKDGFDHGIRTLLELKRMGVKDIGFGITVSDRNAGDMIELYQLAQVMDMEFATAAVHNSFYFHKCDNEIKDKEAVISCFRQLIKELLKSNRVKNWFRGYFNFGVINYIRGNPRLIPCQAGTENFFVTPAGDVLPCNGSEQPWIMGNLHQTCWSEIWEGEVAAEVRRRVGDCRRNCWMIGTAAPVMKKNIKIPLRWILSQKFRRLFGRDIAFD